MTFTGIVVLFASVLPIMVSAITAITLTLPTNVVDVPNDLYETAAQAQVAVDFQFTVSTTATPTIEILLVDDSTETRFGTVLDATIPPVNFNYSLNLLSSLSSEIQPFVIKIKATESPGVDDTQPLIINIRTRPVFLYPFDQQYTYGSILDEYTASYETIVTLQATDQNENLRDVLQFSITNTDPSTNLFDISGWNLIASSTYDDDFYDSSTTHQYTLDISVTNGFLSSSTTIVINVDKNFSPSFSNQQYTGTVLDSAYAGTLVMVVTADDPNEYDGVEYHLSGQGYSHFNMDEEGRITVASSFNLNYNNIKQYTLSLSASDDRGSSSNTVTVIINVETAPEFSGDGEVDIDENTGAYITLYTLDATDDDSMPASITYSMVGSGSTFTLTGTTLSTASSVTTSFFDLESQFATQVYQVVISATDGKYTTSTTININIQDVNDQMPTFDQSFYSIVISELQTTGEEVLKVRATDDDYDSPNNEVTFSLNGNNHEHFDIDNTGSITVKSPSDLDYDQNKAYDLSITVTDEAIINQMSSTVSLRIDIETEPVFDSATETTIDENFGSGRDVYQISASDADSSPSAGVTYDLKSVDPSSGTSFFDLTGFSIKTSASVTTDTFDVDATDSIRSYALELTATDGKYTTTLTLTVSIQDVNDNAPMFTQTSYDVIVLEDTAPLTVIITVDATDADLDVQNNKFTFSLSGEGAEDFIRDPNNGEISINSPSNLDYSNKPIYTLTLTVTDDGGLSSTAPLTVNLETAPKFTFPENDTTEVDLNEHTGPDSILFVCAVIDEDNSPNQLQYSSSIISPMNADTLFIMDGAILKTKSSVSSTTTFDSEDPSAVPEYIVEIVADDTKYSVSTTITLKLQDINDHTPTFPDNGYSFDQLEPLLPGTQIVNVTATDDDFSAPNNEFSYSLSGDGNDDFTISEDGVVTFISPYELYYFNRSSYSLIITVTDKASDNPKSSNETLAVSLETAPKITVPADDTTEVSLNEDAGPADINFTISATDEDSAPSALEYRMADVLPPSGYFLFTMNNNQVIASGIVTTSTFDSEREDAVRSYILKIEARDSMYTATTLLTFNIQDINDNIPVFAEADYTLNVTELQIADEEILTVVVTDDDYSAPNNEFTLSLSGEGSDHFTINDAGVLTVASPSQLDYTTKPSYSLSIIATDKGTDIQLSSTAALTVFIETEPRFTIPLENTTTVEAINEDTGPDIPIFTCMVYDEDIPDATYFIFTVEDVVPTEGTSLFHMDGLILKTSDSVTTDSFDLDVSSGQAVESYLVNIRVSDGKYFDFTQIQVNITDVNDNMPVFEGPITHSINDTLAIGAEVIKVTATDVDFTDAFSTFTYNITAGNGNDDYSTFEIHPDTGSLILTRQLKKLSYTFDVTARDVGNNLGSTTVTITVLDTVNECVPSPCVNSISCVEHINHFYCECEEGWAGETCEINMGDCFPNPCDNNGDCIDGVSSYTCNCSRGWTGTYCTQACSGNTFGRNCAETCQCNDTRLADNTATQKCDVDTGACKCNAQWTGDNCETDVDECTQNTTLCSDQPNTVCVNNDGGYDCLCAQGFEPDSGQTCVPVAEATTASVNQGETVILVLMTQTFTGCDLSTQLSVDRIISMILEAERLRIPSARSIVVSNPVCGSISYELAITINDTDEARTRLAIELNAISNGKPLVIDGQSTVATSLTVVGKQVALNSTIETAVQICNIYTAYRPCGSSYECEVQNGSPYCKEKDKDYLALILGLSLGIPLGLMLIACLVCAVRHVFTKTVKQKSLRGSGRYDSVGRRRDMLAGNFGPALADAPSIIYDYKEPIPNRSSRFSSKDPGFYFPSQPGESEDNYGMSRRF